MQHITERTTYPIGVNDEIRATVRERIQQTGLSQAEVARQMGLEPQELNRALQGRGKIAPVWVTILDFFKLRLTVEKAE